MAFGVEIVGQLTASETVSGVGVTSGLTVDQDALNFRVSLSSGTTPPATKSSYFTKALSGGTGTIDLTSLPNLLNVAAGVTFSGLKLQGIIYQAPSTNTASVVLTKGASNGYGLDAGGATWTLPISPGAKGVLLFDDELPDVSGSVKNIDMSGTGTEGVSLGLIAG